MGTQDKIAGLVILFLPDESALQNINSYFNFVDHLYIVDNSPFLNIQILNALNSEKITIIHDSENKGIAARLNQAIELALKRKIFLLLTMDQDSYFDTADITSYVNCVKNYKFKESIGVFTVENAPALQTPLPSCSSIEVTVTITSGSILNLSNYSRIGPFDENLFIDEVDHEYCLRSIIAGFKIIKFETIFMNHKLGIESSHRSIQSLKLSIRRLHSPLRLYYIVRNHFYIQKKYGKDFKDFFKQRKKDLSVTIKNNLLYGTEKIKSLKFILKGYRDFKRNNMGKLS